MPWARIDDRANSDAKLLALSDSAFRLWVGGLIFCQANLTDGFIPAHVIQTFGIRARSKAPLVRELTTGILGKKPLWQEVTGGWQFNDFLDWNDSREVVIATRQTTKQRIALFRDPGLRQQVRDRDGDICRYCGRTVRWHDRKGELGGTYDHVKPVGGNGLDNLVVCCRSCNSKKGGRTPEQAGMSLLAPKSNPKSSSESRFVQASTTTTTDLEDQDPRRAPFPPPVEKRRRQQPSTRVTEIRAHLRASCHDLIEGPDAQYHAGHPNQDVNLFDRMKWIAAARFHCEDYNGTEIRKIVDAVLGARARRSA